MTTVRTDIDLVRRASARAVLPASAGPSQSAAPAASVASDRSGHSTPSALRRNRARVGIGAPKNTPAGFIDTLNREINAGLADVKLKARFADLGATALPGSPGDFGKLIADETEKWGKVIRAANIKPE